LKKKLAINATFVIRTYTMISTGDPSYVHICSRLIRTPIRK